MALTPGKYLSPMDRRKLAHALLVVVLCGPSAQGQNLCLDYIGFEGSGGLNLWGIVAAQLNDDTLLDVAVSNALTNDLSVLFGNGDADLQPPMTMPVGMAPTDIAAADVNNDGLTDLITAGLGSGASVLLNLGGGSFAPYVNYPVPGGNTYTFQVRDADGDGTIDLLVPNGEGTGGLAVLLGNGDGTFALAVVYPTDIYPASLDLADLNNDGHLDAVYAHLPGLGETIHFFSILWGTGPGTFGTRTHLTYPYTSLFAIAADVDGDGNMDVLTSNCSTDSVSKFIGHGDGTFEPPVTFFGAFQPSSLQLADIDLDGFEDLLVADYGGNAMNVFPGDGTGNFGTHAHIVSAVDPIEFAVGRLNADAYPDIMVADSDGAYIHIIVNCLVAGVEDHAPAAPLALFPNPVDDVLNLSFPSLDGAEVIEIMDASGRIVIRERAVPGIAQVDTRSLSNGIYCARIATARNGAPHVGRFVVAHP